MEQNIQEKKWNRLRDDLPHAVDLSHHLSQLAKARQPSPLKSFFRFYGRPGLLALAGGVPHPDYFPFATLEAATLPSDAYPAHPSAVSNHSTTTGPLSWLWNLFGASGGKTRVDHISVPKYVAEPTKEVNLAVSLQYSTARGITELQEFLKEYSKRFYDPGYADFDILVHTGNTDGWSRVAYTLLDHNDSVLVEDYTYPSSLYTALPLGAKTVSVPMDSQGMIPRKLEEVLENWDEAVRGFKRPHLMYTVPVGQNPSGLTTGAERKKAIYAICVKYDIIICEDDPYFILQEGEYKPRNARNSVKGSKIVGSAAVNDDEEIDQFIESLVPSYLKFDYQGRVIRLDTFSKTVAPGSRLGWFTGSPQLLERLERQGETSTQAPCGFGQALITQLLTKQWGLGAYTRWLRGLQTQYTIRRDALVDAFMDQFDIGMTQAAIGGTWEGATVYEAKLKDKNSQLGLRWSNEKKKPRPTVMSFIPPSSGMFIWVKMNFESLPVPKPKDGDQKVAEHESLFWEALAEANLLILPGWIFNGDPTHPTDDPNLCGHYRISFSDSTEADMKRAVSIFAKVTEQYFSSPL